MKTQMIIKIIVFCLIATITSLTNANVLPSREELKVALQKENFEVGDAGKITQAFENNSLFNYISIAAFGSAAEKNYVEKDDISTGLQCLSKPGDSEALKRKAWEELVKKMDKEGLLGENLRPLLEDKELLDEALTLFLTGKAEKDIKSSVNAISEKFMKLSSQENLKNSVYAVFDPNNPKEWLKAFFEDGTNQDPKKIFSHVLQKFNNDQLVGSHASDIINVLIKKDNRTMRLAIIAYARMNGIKIKDENLDQVGEALRKENPTLSPAMVGAIQYYKDKYKVNYIDKVSTFLKHKPTQETCPS